MPPPSFRVLVRAAASKSSGGRGKNARRRRPSNSGDQSSLRRPVKNKYSKRIEQHMQIAFLDDVCSLEDPSVSSSHLLPKLVVYDLDDTIWFPELYMIAGAPFTKDVSTKTIKDASGTEIAVYPAARESMRLIAQTSEAFRKRGTKIAVASRTHRGKWAHELMELFEFDDCPSLKDWISHVDIASGTKMRHFERIRQASGVAYDDMLFFDNERDNCVDVAPLGVTCIHCPSGMSQDAWERGLRLFAELKTESVR